MAKNLISCRKILYPGSGHLPDFGDGTKVRFHFKTVKINSDGEEVVIDDSKAYGKPMELIIGKKFKLILWEEWIKHMKVNEISQIVADKQLCISYPFVSKCFRKYCRQNTDSAEEDIPRHCCGMAMKTGLGHTDLDDLVSNPSDLQFTIELLSVENAEDYDKEVWQMSTQEMEESIPKYRNEGNILYSKKQYSESALLYSKALGIVEQLLLREKPGDEDWLRLDQLKVPLLSNLSQCKLLEKDFYSVIEYTTEVLKRDPNNTKALFRRGKANTSVWNLEDAKQDFQRVLTLDPSLANTVKKELLSIDILDKNCNKKDMELLKGKLFS